MLNGTFVTLRAIEPKDIDLMHQWENDTDVWNISGTSSPFSKYTLEQYIESCRHDIYSNKQLRLAIDLLDAASQTIGYIDLFDFEPHNRRAGVGILIGDKSQRRKNYASDSLKVLVKYAFGILQLHQLYTHVHESNHGSVRLFSNTGFIQTGILKDWILNNGEWENVLVMQLCSTIEIDED